MVVSSVRNNFHQRRRLETYDNIDSPACLESTPCFWPARKSSRASEQNLRCCFARGRGAGQEKTAVHGDVLSQLPRQRHGSESPRAKEESTANWTNCQKVCENEIELQGHTYCTRFVTAVLPRHLYFEDDRSFNALQQKVYEDAAALSRDGLTDRYGQRFWAVVLKTTGDWPFLAKAGNLDKTFANAVKHADQQARGMCHLCGAGPHPVPFEEIGTRQPSWQQSVDTVSPFKRLPPAECLENEPSRLAAHSAFDLFHTFHLGVGKSFIGSILALLSDLETGNIEERFDKLTFKYHSWCRAQAKSAVVPRLHKDLIQWATTTDYPVGSWFKAALTTNLMEFF